MGGEENNCSHGTIIGGGSGSGDSDHRKTMIIIIIILGRKDAVES